MGPARPDNTIIFILNPTQYQPFIPWFTDGFKMDRPGAPRLRLGTQHDVKSAQGGWDPVLRGQLEW